MASTRYIMTMGELKKKDYSICYRTKGENVYLPVENMKEIYCLNEVSLNTKLLSFLSKNHIVLHFFNYYGGYSGTFFPKEQYLSGKLLMKQVEKCEKERLRIAKAIVLGTGLNIGEVLRHYQKHGKEAVGENIRWIQNEFRALIEKSSNTNQLMAVEGEVWKRFYRNFEVILPEAYHMDRRTRRPPENAINAMISFGNTLLYTKAITAIYHTHLDQRISFLHEPSEGRFSLSLDLSEVFKPIIVDKTIFELINHKKIQIEKHFDKTVNQCLLNEEGKKLFVEAFESRMETVFEHPRLHRKVSYWTAMKLDCYKLIKDIMEDKDFVPFSLKELQ